jgi:hypothetical protein
LLTSDSESDDTRSFPPFTEHGNNSQIWYRDAPLVSEPNRSATALSRSPYLIVALEKLRLTHLQFDSPYDASHVGIGERTELGDWRRQREIDALWLKLIDNSDDISHVCQVGLGGGYMAVMYLEALPNATVTIYDSCASDAEKLVCDVAEKFFTLNYAVDRVRLVRAHDIARRLVLDTRGYWPKSDAGSPDAAFVDPVWGPVIKAGAGDDGATGALPDDSSYKSLDKNMKPKKKPITDVSSAESTIDMGRRRRKRSKTSSSSSESSDKSALTDAERAPSAANITERPCDWIGIDVHGVPDLPVGLLKILRPAVACPNLLYMNDVGRETNDPRLAAGAREWEAGVQDRISMQSHCSPCYDDAQECNFCFGSFLCGAVAAAAEDALLHPAEAADDVDARGNGTAAASSLTFIRPPTGSAAAAGNMSDPDADSDNSRESDEDEDDTRSSGENDRLQEDEDEIEEKAKKN